MLRVMSLRISFSLLAVVLASPACAKPSHPIPDSDELIAAERAFDSVTAVNGVEGWTSFFADSGREYPDQGDAVVGKAAIHEHMRGLLSDTTMSLRWAADFARIAAGGDLGYTTGHWQLSHRDSTGLQPVARGKYLTVWRRQSDGTWKVEADIGNTEPPPPAK